MWQFKGSGLYVYFLYNNFKNPNNSIIDTPLDDEDFKDMGVSITTIDPEHIAKLKEVHDFIKDKQSRSTWPYRNTIRYYDSCILGTQSGYIFQCDYNDSTDRIKRYKYVPRYSTRYEDD